MLNKIIFTIYKEPWMVNGLNKFFKYLLECILLSIIEIILFQIYYHLEGIL